MQETRLWDADKRHLARRCARKEQAHDYRYFPEPDLPPLVVDEAWIARVRGELPELPMARCAALLQALGLSAQDAGVLAAERAIADYFDDAVAAGAAAEEGGQLGHRPSLATAARRCPRRASPSSSRSSTRARSAARSPRTSSTRCGPPARAPAAIVADEGLTQVTDAGAIEAACRAAVDANPKQVAHYRGGNPKILGFFVGQVMKATGGKANPEMVNEILRRLLS